MCGLIERLLAGASINIATSICSTSGTERMSLSVIWISGLGVRIFLQII